MKRAWLWLIRHTLNHLTIRVARSKRGPYLVMRHVGRKTGIVRETPIITAEVPGGFMIELTYGPQVQWYRNIRAAGGCVVVRHQVEHRIVDFQEVDAATGRAAFTPFQQRVLKLLNRREFVKLVEG